MNARARRFARSASVYVPLLMHLVPTLGIGFLVLIPRSCIAGANELTLGFAGANLGYALSYVAGIRLARRRGGEDA